MSPLFQFIGLWIIFGAVLAVALMSVIRSIKCRCKHSDCCNRELDYYKVILKEEESVLKEILTTAAKEKLTEGIKDKLRSDKWTECFDVAEELIDNDTPPPVATESQVIYHHLLPPC